MNRRGFISTTALAAAGFTLDPERLLWRPGAKSYFDIHRPAAVGGVLFTTYTWWRNASEGDHPGCEWRIRQGSVEEVRADMLAGRTPGWFLRYPPDEKYGNFGSVKNIK